MLRCICFWTFCTIGSTWLEIYQEYEFLCTDMTDLNWKCTRKCIDRLINCCYTGICLCQCVYLSAVCDTVCVGLFPGKENRNRLIMEFLERGFRHPQPKNCPREMYEIMLKCWMKTPEERPTFEFLFNTMDDFSVAVASSYAET